MQEERLYISSWLRNTVSLLEEAGTTVYSVKKPKSIIETDSSLLIMSSHPGQLSVLNGATLLKKEKSHFVRGVWHAFSKMVLIADVEENVVWRVDPITRDVQPFVRLQDGIITDLAATADWVFVLVHHSGTGYSIGTGEVLVYSIQSGAVVDRIPTTNKPTRMTLYEDTLVVSDQTFRTFLFFDISLLSHDSQSKP